VTVTDVPDVLADPVGTAVALITAMDPGLSREAAEQAVTGVARGRAVRRKLAAALAGRPGILTDGRSPAPKVAGDLLLALRKAGSAVISPPACAGCGRQLRTLSRLGQDWYCAPAPAGTAAARPAGGKRSSPAVTGKGSPAAPGAPTGMTATRSPSSRRSSPQRSPL